MEHSDNSAVSIYLMGSFSTKDMTKKSDIDIIGIMKPDFNFRKERTINSILNKKIKSSHKISLGLMSYDEFFGGKKQGSLSMHIALPVFLNFLKTAKHVHGKKLDFDKFPAKPAKPKEELNYHIKFFSLFKNKFRRKDRISEDFEFRDFVKMIFYVASLELLIKNHAARKTSYSDIEAAFRKDKIHIVHISLKLRKKDMISDREKQDWLDKAELYINEMKKLAINMPP